MGGLAGDSFPSSHCSVSPQTSVQSEVCPTRTRNPEALSPLYPFLGGQSVLATPDHGDFRLALGRDPWRSTAAPAHCPSPPNSPLCFGLGCGQSWEKGQNPRSPDPRAGTGGHPGGGGDPWRGPCSGRKAFVCLALNPPRVSHFPSPGQSRPSP